MHDMQRRREPEHFADELKDKHVLYRYENGWDYELWCPNHERVSYRIHGGPMKGRSNFQTAYYQRVRAQIWQMSWVEETGTIVSIVIDLGQRTFTTFMTFSKGHWENPAIAHGTKQTHFEQWRKLSEIGNPARERRTITERAHIHEIFDGRGELDEIDMSLPTL